MAFDGLVAGALVHELKEKILFGKIEKIYQQGPHSLSLNISANGAKYILFINVSPAGPGTYLLDKNLENPANPYNFCMVLRKHLSRAFIKDVTQVGRDRILEIHLECINELGHKSNKILINEIMGKHSNLILIEEEGQKIIDGIKRVSFDCSSRPVLPGFPYTPPPIQGKDPLINISSDLIDKIMRGRGSLDKNLLDNLEGFSPVFCQEIVHRLDKFENPKSEDLESILKGIKEDLDSHNYTYSLYLNKENFPQDFYIFPISMYEGIYLEKPYESLSGLLRSFFQNRASANILNQKKSNLEKSLLSSAEKLQTKKGRLLQDKKEAETKLVYKLYGELLTSYLPNIKEGEESIKLNNYYDNCPLEIRLDPELSPVQNAQAYYKKYSKAKKALMEKEIQLKRTEKDLTYLESVGQFLDRADSIQLLDEIRDELALTGFIRRVDKYKNRKNSFKKKKQVYIEYEISSEAKVRVGRNNLENDSLTFKDARPGDYWFHAKDYPGSHVLLTLKGGPPTEKQILEAASIAAWYSKGRESSRVPVDFTPVRHVKKMPGAKPGMVTFSHHKTVYVNPKLV